MSEINMAAAGEIDALKKSVDIATGAPDGVAMAAVVEDVQAPPVGSVLAEASQMVFRSRQKDYGHPADMCWRIARMWSAILDVPITSKKVALMLAAMKIARELGRHKRDNLVDLAGYAEVANMVEDACTPGSECEKLEKVIREAEQPLGVTMSDGTPVGYHRK